ncbi:MAG: ArsR family transcriptional regulator [Candidatus Manganitrophaceae bacterium]|nr:MAG: ArsR family transcriptional regulator [Candidatus Manganitrophaceae bacterium]
MRNKLVILSDQALELVAARFRILGEPMRLKLLRALLDGEKTVSELIGETKGTQANVSKHLNLLTQAGLLGRRREGLNVYYSIADESIFELCQMVCGRLQEQFEQQAKALSSSHS